MDLKISLYRIVLAIFTIYSLFLLTKIRRLYRDPSIITLTPQNWWPYNDRAWRKFAKVIPLSPIPATFGSIGATVGEYRDTSDQVIKIIILLSLFLLFSCFLLMIFIALTSRPKRLIPPHLR
jgi:hypothetical protein